MLEGEVGEALEDFGDKDIEDFVDLDEVLEEQENHVGVEPGALAEVLVLKHIEDLRDQCVETLVI